MKFNQNSITQHACMHTHIHIDCRRQNTKVMLNILIILMKLLFIYSVDLLRTLVALNNDKISLS